MIEDRLAVLRRERDAILLAKEQGYRWLTQSQKDWREQMLVRFSTEITRLEQLITVD